MSEVNMCATPTPRPWYQRTYLGIVYKLFSPGQPFPWQEEDSHRGHGVCVEVHIVFDWKDKLRILFGGIPVAKSVVTTENEPGATSTRTSICVQRPASRPAKESLWRPK